MVEVDVVDHGDFFARLQPFGDLDPVQTAKANVDLALDDFPALEHKYRRPFAAVEHRPPRYQWHIIMAPDGDDDLAGAVGRELLGRSLDLEIHIIAMGLGIRE